MSCVCLFHHIRIKPKSFGQEGDLETSFGASGGNRTHTKADNLSERRYKHPLHPMHTRLTSYIHSTTELLACQALFCGRCEEPHRHLTRPSYHKASCLSSTFFLPPCRCRLLHDHLTITSIPQHRLAVNHFLYSLISKFKSSKIPQKGQYSITVLSALYLKQEYGISSSNHIYAPSLVSSQHRTNCLLMYPSTVDTQYTTGGSPCQPLSFAYIYRGFS